MPNAPEFNLAAAHKFFSTDCFNRAWDLIDKPTRSAEEDRIMVLLNQASLYHWSQRSDNDNKSMSIGYWQASRIQSLLGNAAEAKRYAEICLEYSRALQPFYLGYAYEALARAASLAGDAAGFENFKVEASKQAGLVSGSEDRDALLKDITGIK